METKDVNEKKKTIKGAESIAEQTSKASIILSVMHGTKQGLCMYKMHVIIYN